MTYSSKHKRRVTRKLLTGLYSLLVSAIPDDLCCFLHLNHDSLSRYYARLAYTIDNLPVLTSCWFDISSMLSSDVKGPVVHLQMTDMAHRDRQII